MLNHYLWKYKETRKLEIIRFCFQKNLNERGILWLLYLQNEFPIWKVPKLEWYPYVSLLTDLLCKFGNLSVSGLRKIRLNAYTPRRISTKNQFLNKPGFPLSALIILDWYPYVSLFPDLFCNIGWSVSGLRKIRFNAYTPHRISTKKLVPKETRIPIVHVNNFRLVSLRFFFIKVSLQSPVLWPI